MVMLYALPLSLFAGMTGMSRDQVLSQGPLAFAILLGMAGGYAIVFFISRYLFRRDLMTASWRPLAIAGPAVPSMPRQIFCESEHLLAQLWIGLLCLLGKGWQRKADCQPSEGKQ